MPFFPGAYGIEEFHKKLEDHLFTHYKARPHWAKNMYLSLDRIDQLYPDLDKWRRVYLLFNSDGTFDNEFTRKVGFEDFRGSDSCPDQHPLPTISALAKHRLVDANISHDDHLHVRSLEVTSAKVTRSEVTSAKVTRSEVTSAKVISSQPKKSKDFPNTFEYGKSHFKPIPISHFSK